MGQPHVLGPNSGQCESFPYSVLEKSYKQCTLLCNSSTAKQNKEACGLLGRAFGYSASAIPMHWGMGSSENKTTRLVPDSLAPTWDILFLLLIKENGFQQSWKGIIASLEPSFMSVVSSVSQRVCPVRSFSEKHVSF